MFRCLPFSRTDASLEPRDLFFELIDSFLERAQSQFTNVRVRRRTVQLSRVELFQFLEFLPLVLQLAPVFNAHRITA